MFSQKRLADRGEPGAHAVPEFVQVIAQLLLEPLAQATLEIADREASTLSIAATHAR
jgi:hypothetical protein